MSQHGTLGDHWGFIGQLGIIGASLRDHLVPGYEPFLATILDAPYEDAPRLVYADWLEEQGDPRAEFIRVQCERSRLPADDPEFNDQRERLEDRESKLLLAYGDGWRAEIPEWARKNCEFERGFVHHVNIRTDWQHHYGLVLSRAAPIDKITLQNVAGCAIEFADGPQLRHYAGLVILDQQMEYDDLRELMRSSAVTEPLRSLQFMGIGGKFGDTGALEVSLAPGLTNLTRLELVRCNVGHRGIDRLSASEFVKKVTWLDLSDNELTDDCIWLLAHSEWSRPITHLFLNRNQIHNIGVQGMVESPHLANLTHLELDYNFLGDRAARLLIERFPNLRHLSIEHNSLTVSGCLDLQRAYGPRVKFGNPFER